MTMERHVPGTIVALLAVLMVFQSQAAVRPVVAEPSLPLASGGFRFISWGDSQNEAANLTATAQQATSLNPSFTIFNGDFEQDGFRSNEMNPMVAALGGLYPRTFFVRGNHDDHVSGSATLWQNYLASAKRPLPAGITNYVPLNSTSTYLSYSFDYGNSRFIGVDVPGGQDLLTSAQVSFMDARLTDAEARGLAHAFLFFHSGEYCIANHCSCSAAADGGCTSASLVALLNKHPIVSATFHGHEHVLAWVHMSNARVPALTRSYEEFFTSPSGGVTNNPDLHPARVDYYYPSMSSSRGFASVDVNGSSFTVSFYKVGVSAPVYSRTFSRASTPRTVIYRSIAAQDGWVRESSETSGVGDIANAAAPSLILGDDASGRQYVATLSFPTAALPDNAAITSAAITLVKQSVVPLGTDPLTIFNGLIFGLRTGYFGTSSSLEPADFQTPGTIGGLSPARVVTSSTAWRIVLPPAAFPYINKTAVNGGLTQLRLRFKLDDNNDAVANYISFLSGETAVFGDRPALTITYSQP